MTTAGSARPAPDDGPFGPVVEGRLRVRTWNLWWRFGPWEQRGPAIATTLGQLDPDVACLQEVWAHGDDAFAARLAGWPERGGAGQVTRCEVHGLEPVDSVVPSDHPAVVAELRC